MGLSFKEIILHLAIDQGLFNSNFSWNNLIIDASIDNKLQAHSDQCIVINKVVWCLADTWCLFRQLFLKSGHFLMSSLDRDGRLERHKKETSQTHRRPSLILLLADQKVSLRWQSPRRDLAELCTPQRVFLMAFIFMRRSEIKQSSAQWGCWEFLNLHLHIHKGIRSPIYGDA